MPVCYQLHYITTLKNNLVEHLLFRSQEHLLTFTHQRPVQTFFWFTFFGQAHAIVIFDFRSAFNQNLKLRFQSELSVINQYPREDSNLFCNFRKVKCYPSHSGDIKQERQESNPHQLVWNQLSYH